MSGTLFNSHTQLLDLHISCEQTFSGLDEVSINAATHHISYAL